MQLIKNNIHTQKWLQTYGKHFTAVRYKKHSLQIQFYKLASYNDDWKVENLIRDVSVSMNNFIYVIFYPRPLDSFPDSIHLQEGNEIRERIKPTLYLVLIWSIWNLCTVFYCYSQSHFDENDFIRVHTINLHICRSICRPSPHTPTRLTNWLN